MTWYGIAAMLAAFAGLCVAVYRLGSALAAAFMDEATDQ